MKRPDVHRGLVLERAVVRGSSWPVVLQTTGGRYFTKLRGAGHGSAALVAEWIVAGLARELGLRVPALALIEIDADLERLDRDHELADLVAHSRGTNLGFELLEAARELGAGDLERVDEDLASRIAWLDVLVENVDRTPENPNLLRHRDQIWLIDHGSALAFHHDWSRVSEDTPREIGHIRHALARRATRLEALDAELAGRLSRNVLDRVVDSTPAELLDAETDDARFRLRRAYGAYLWKRLKAPRGFSRALLA